MVWPFVVKFLESVSTNDRRDRRRRRCRPIRPRVPRRARTPCIHRSPARPVGQLRATGGDDPALDEDVDVIGLQLVEQPVVVRDGQHAEVVPLVVAESSTAAGKSRSASMSRPESSSSRIAIFGASTASCSVSLRFFSPPERSTLSERSRNRSSKPMRSASLEQLAASSPAVPRPAAANASSQHVVELHTGHLGRVLHHQMQAGAGPVARRAAQARRRRRA